MTPSDEETQFLLDRLGGGAELAIVGLRRQLAKAEAEAARLRKDWKRLDGVLQWSDGERTKLEAERDRYKRAVDDASEELKRGNVAAAGSWLRAALYQREES